MSTSDTFDLIAANDPESNAAKRSKLTKAQKAALIGAGGAAILSGSALAWGMSRNGSINPFATEVPPASDQPDGDGELTGEVPVGSGANENVSTEMPADSTSVAPPGPVGTLTPMEPQETIPTPEPLGTTEPVPNAPVGAAGSASASTGFEQAFAEARQEVGPGGYFVWNGNVYNTFFKEEWEAMSPAEQQDYVAAVQEDRFENWKVEPSPGQPVIIDDSKADLVLGDPNEKQEVPVETDESAELDWVAVNVDGHNVVLASTDDDDTAEVMIVDGQIAVVDADNDGVFEYGGRIDSEGHVENWVELEKPIDAPSLGDARGTEEANPLYTSGESGDFGDDFDNQAGTSDFV